VGFWDKCLVDCGEGEQERTVFCQQEHEPDIYVMVEDSLCQDNPRPRSNRPCDTGVPCPEPQVSAYTASEVSPEESDDSEVSELESESDVSSPSSEDSDADSEIGQTSEWDVSDLLPEPKPEKLVRSSGLYPAIKAEPAAWDLGPWSAVSVLT